MKSFKTFILFILLAPLIVMGQNIEVIKFHELEKKYMNDSDTLYLVNYWATWCKPCVEELPDFIKLNTLLKDQKFKMILVSLDFPSQIDSRVKPFIRENGIQAEVVVLDDDANVWINKVNKDWDGDIPVTQIIQKQKKEFYNSTLTYSELIDITEIKLK
ncbi:TlpA family protein disulfide reductase [Lentimicrobium sp. L6]|uniref:TlpA disulfide reductase family protein n=1 Tax=Lentimicrobium sp. L6 TaxID=2735916 RepID=UPI0015520A0B|nr:TlpA disulfide reductase family protein [Lentimicrobium sp. L6]NPD85879.1 TlpA family protein disulfide reductase [Lentimicrobium sp. L6]